MTIKAIRNPVRFLTEKFLAPVSLVRQYRVIAALEDRDGYEGRCWFLLQSRLNPGSLFEVHGSHCSCMGYENQFAPSPTSIAYLKSHHFSALSGQIKAKHLREVVASLEDTHHRYGWEEDNDENDDENDD